ncbi:hypothetical protein [Halostagnicola sp. A-GB9-2]|uniref:hypothetical protein n=1 Tax=Halostagnicola sp. A-GB9-2 TaxID=3048066 RepID=UPI0024BF9FD1|nr:hypothetical protein [Halostagnicola sp. A-GB9-2]MDJ1432281.1 hypothetical protein [Halostagnicola sp. A-GB9-2]
MDLYPGVTKVTGVCGNCGDDLVMFLSPYAGILENGANECSDCESTDFQRAV